VTPLGEADVCIWYRGTAGLGCDAVKSADRHLSIDERSRRDRLRFEADRRDFTIAHDLLRRSLSRHADISPADWRFVTDEHGKPSIDSTDPQASALSFGLSHTRGFVACAVTSKGLVGIDVERIDPSRQIEEIADRYFAEKESAWLSQSPDDLRPVRFAELWTMKEAFLKATGLGLAGPLADISFYFNEHAGIEFSGQLAIDSRQWHFALFEPMSDVRLGVAVRSVAPPRFFTRQDDGDGRMLAPIRTSSPY
jgi:4'-phosphopantetheinyl transferase